jgi:hypothetical protein
MQQISLYLKGERDYAKITGSTGPLVYPGAHVWIYTQLYRITDEGRNIERAQYLFALVYLGCLGVVGGCYRKAKVGHHHHVYFLRGGNANLKYRSHHTSFPYSYYRRDYTASSSYAFSTIASLSWGSLQRFTRISAINGIWAVSCSLRG